MSDWKAKLGELSAAEEFLNFFGVPYDPKVVHVNRLHILKRFHDYLKRAGAVQGDSQAQWDAHKALLGKAYSDFVDSDAATEKVFKVFQQAQGTQFVPLEALRDGLQGSKAAP
jgi:nitrogenase-stabilizing/protective protein